MHPEHSGGRQWSPILATKAFSFPISFPCKAREERKIATRWRAIAIVTLKIVSRLLSLDNAALIIQIQTHSVIWGNQGETRMVVISVCLRVCVCCCRAAPWSCSLCAREKMGELRLTSLPIVLFCFYLVMVRMQSHRGIKEKGEAMTFCKCQNYLNDYTTIVAHRSCIHMGASTILFELQVGFTV